MKTIIRNLIFLGLLVLIGCATLYQKKGLSGGYTDQYLGNDIYMISVRVNAYTDEATAYEYFHRRANEICQASGYARYEVLEFGTSEKKNLVYYGNQAHMMQKPRVYGRIQCYKD